MILFVEKLASLLNSREKLSVLFLFFLILTGAFLEVLGVGALLPLIMLLSKPDAIQENVYLDKAYVWLDPASTNEFIVFCLAIVLVTYILKNAFLNRGISQIPQQMLKKSLCLFPLMWIFISLHWKH